MRIHKLIALVLLALAGTAGADFRTVVEVYEMELVNVRLPGTEGGTIAIKHCDDCKSQLLRVSASTRYIVNGKDVRLADFRRTVSSIRNRGDVIIDVFHNLDSNTVTRLRVKL